MARPVTSPVVLLCCFSILPPLAAIGCGSGRVELMTPDQAAAISRALSTEGKDPTGVDIYFDVSGSMRGFALAAKANDQAAAPGYSSFLQALRSLPAQIPLEPGPSGDSKPDGSRDQAASPAGSRTSSFGSVVDAPTPLDQFIEQALAQKKAPARTREGITGSSNCSQPQAWPGGANVRGLIDEFYADRSTCLDRVFEKVLQTGPGRLNLIVTDAEQNAPVNDQSCPNPQNPIAIQSYLNKWTENGGFAALIVASIRYQPWQSPGAVGYCTCQEKLLITYVLAPSAKTAERVFTHFQEYWPPDRTLSYVPLLPRPVVAFELLAIADTDAGNPSVLFRDPTSDLNPRRVGSLPRVSLELTKTDEAILEFRLAKATFQSAALSGFQQVDWTKARLEWLDPVALDNQGKPTKADGLSLVRMVGAEVPTPAKSTGPEAAAATPPALSRTLKFLGQATESPASAGQPQSSPLRLRVRRTVARGEGCAWFLVEVTAPIREQNRYLLQTLEKHQSTECVNWNQVRRQLELLVPRGAVMKFLVHIDY